ncbi:MAG: hypothetical protein JRH15_15765 [Deltaproteobacteria bacterium]|nr:hypothetical protein [Deltaproteobacteria bacterium]
MLSKNSTISSNDTFAFYETIPFNLEPGEAVYRDDWNAAYFNIYKDEFGNDIPAGTYYMAVSADSLNIENESNEMNNVSYSWGRVYIPSHRFNASEKSEQALDPGAKDDNKNQLSGKAYNGRKLPSERIILRQDHSSRTPAASALKRIPGKKELAELLKYIEGSQNILF